jgi:hypothetical protein
MNRYKRFFYSSERFFLLRTTGFLVGLAVAIPFSIFWMPVAGLLPSLVASILCDMYLFKIKGLKESSYKSPEALHKMMGCSADTYDRYASVITWTRPVVFVVMAAVGIYVSSRGGILSNLMIAPIFYWPMMNLFVTPRIAIKRSIMKYEWDESDEMPWHYGVPGFNAQGHYTGSPTSVGGCSG